MSVLGIFILAAAVLFTFFFNSLIIKRNVADKAFALVRGLIKKRSELIADWLKTLPEDEQENAEVQKVKELSEQLLVLPETDRLKPDFLLSDALKNAAALPEIPEELREIEQNLQKARDYYNEAVANLTSAVSYQPGKLFAGMMHIKKYTPWQIEQ